MKELLFQGAESRVYVETYLGINMIVKERFKKKYRNPELDDHLIKERTKAECRSLVRCKRFGVRTPAVYRVDLDRGTIYMEYFESSVTVKKYLQDLEKKNELSTDKIRGVAHLLGETIANMHVHNIAHGDLTTSNFLLIPQNGLNEDIIVMIDFGLSHFEANDEDKGVDLYVLERALTSTHVNTSEFFSELLKRYCEVYGDKSISVMKKFEEVRARGRKRSMVG